MEENGLPGLEWVRVGEGEVRGCLSKFVDDGSTESHRYYLSRRTTLEMLRDRGYSVPSHEIDLSLSEFREMHGQSPDPDRLRLSLTHATNPSKRVSIPTQRVSLSASVLVIFCGTGVVKVTDIRNIAGQIVNRDTLTGLILIVQNHITSQALKAVNLFSFKVEIFQITDLLVNITKHVLKPKHQVLTDRQKQNLLKKYNIEEKQLPRMLQTDAIARYYGLERGQVVKVTYSGEITQMHVTYRCVW
ncbi:DNA-directed RNA polymerase V subunit 5A [Spatholobus suberectus]|nr:DNA-directed RNA polymerase V subunit 5A [Spatholobus suberectus]